MGHALEGDRRTLVHFSFCPVHEVNGPLLVHTLDMVFYVNAGSRQGSQSVPDRNLYNCEPSFTLTHHNSSYNRKLTNKLAIFL